MKARRTASARLVRVLITRGARGSRWWRVAALLCLVSALMTVAATAAHPRHAQSPASLPHDAHDGFTIAADAYSSAPRAKSKFGKDNPLSAGLLPIDVFLSNDSTAAMRVQLETIRFEVNPSSGERQELKPLSVEETAERIASPAGAAGPSQSRLPLPIPHHGKQAEKIAEVLRPLSLDAEVIAPHSTVHGFLFFDVSGEFYLLSRATLYIPDVRAIDGGRAITFFEVAFPAPPAP